MDDRPTSTDAASRVSRFELAPPRHFVLPAILLLLSLFVDGIIVLRVVPDFGTFYEQFDRDLPLSTRTIVAASEFIRSYAFGIVAVGDEDTSVTSGTISTAGAGMVIGLLYAAPKHGNVQKALEDTREMGVDDRGVRRLRP